MLCIVHVMYYEYIVQSNITSNNNNIKEGGAKTVFYYGAEVGTGTNLRFKKQSPHYS